MGILASKTLRPAENAEECHAHRLFGAHCLVDALQLSRLVLELPMDGLLTSECMALVRRCTGQACVQLRG